MEIAAFAHLILSDPAWSAATTSMASGALAGMVAWALARLGGIEEALRPIRTIRGK